jgi:all-trans-retinol dehydrogenase (NAD+)
MLSKRKGHIVTIASMASFVAAPGLLDYCCSKVGALFVSEGRSSLRSYIYHSCNQSLTNTPLGIRAECLTRYPGGEGICTTSVHPSWHSTGILKGAEKELNKHGIFPDPPSNVSNLVLEQVLKGRSGRLIVPKSEEGKIGLRNWPIWIQDLIFGFVSKRKWDQFEFGQDHNSKLALDPSLV